MMKMRAALLQGAVILAALSASAARADLENENLLVTAPPGYKVGFSDKKPNMLMTEFVPAKGNRRELDRDGDGAGLLRA